MKDFTILSFNLYHLWRLNVQSFKILSVQDLSVQYFIVQSLSFIVMEKPKRSLVALEIQDWPP